MYVCLFLIRYTGNAIRILGEIVVKTAVQSFWRLESSEHAGSYLAINFIMSLFLWYI